MEFLRGLFSILAIVSSSGNLGLYEVRGLEVSAHIFPHRCAEEFYWQTEMDDSRIVFLDLSGAYPDQSVRLPYLLSREVDGSYFKVFDSWTQSDCFFTVLPWTGTYKIVMLDMINPTSLDVVATGDSVAVHLVTQCVVHW